ncbi:dihydrofolate reductase family protein [Arthrobacter psychrolactophilus]
MNILDTLAELKARPGREIQIHGSSVLAESLFSVGLIDEVRLVVAPVVVGSGRRLFPEGSTPTGLRLLSSKTTPGGLVLHKYQVVGSASHSTYTGVQDVPSR